MRTTEVGNAMQQFDWDFPLERTRFATPSTKRSIDDGTHPDVVKMITGKKLSISDYLHANLNNMKESIERYAERRPLLGGEM